MLKENNNNNDNAIPHQVRNDLVFNFCHCGLDPQSHNREIYHNLYYVGGVVRDERLGLESIDVDVVYEGNAIAFGRSLPNAEVIQINEPFGTVRVKINGREIDIASTREEVYERKGHLPTVTKIGCTLKDDVKRRDFTINALYKSVATGEIIDYTGGLEDLKTKKLRVLHDESFIDDPTRILRALKFSVRFGFTLDAHTKNLQDEYLKNINYDMCYKRIKKELIETFNLNSYNAFEKFINDGVYKLVTPCNTILPSVNIENLIRRHSVERPWLVYVGVLRDLSRLPLTKTEQKILDDFNAIGELKSDFEIYKAFEKAQPETVLLYAVLKNENAALKYLDKLSKIKISINGKDLQELGLAPSPKYQEVFDYVLVRKLANPVMSRQDELEIVRHYLID